MSNDSRGTREFDEDGFHEIQLSGKQLVFLCMATTVVSIVIFLCGVLVGRGVRPVEPVAEAASVQPSEAPAPIDTPAPAPEPVTPPPAAVTPAAAPPATVAPRPDAKAGKPAAAAAAPAQAQNEPAPPPDGPDELSYYDELARKGGKKGGKDAKAPANAATPAPAAAAPAAAPKPAAPAPAAAESHAGGPIAVQVGALKSRGDAEAMARRLSGKGYAAYVISPEAGGPAVFKVRVGNFTNADEANRVKKRLEQEEKLKPWIIR